MKNTSLKIAYLSAEDPKNKKVWSGTHYSIYKALQSMGKVTILGPFHPKLPLTFGKIVNQLFIKVLNKRFDYRHSIFLSKAYGRFFSTKINSETFDLIVAPAASAEIAFLNTTIPVIYITDGTFQSCLNYHKSLTGLTNQSIISGNLIESKAIAKSKVVIVSSEWAADSLKTDYKTPAEKITIIPFGANFETLPSEHELVFETPTEWKLLFVAVYWESKGGPIIFKTFNMLREKGYNVSLTILGCVPPADVKDEKITIIPFIDKNDPDGQQQLSEIYKAHHLLILPTRFDCSPIVINEASAFGIPCIVSDTGGIRGHLSNGQNGFLVDHNDTGEKFADIIGDMITDPLTYIKLRQSTRKEYVDKLNWHHWITKFQETLKQL
ncbi:MAG: glycosyltransferase [Bacteroidetes bacterium]|nr:glycosyltransferase [Bacteroidota bacterium]